MPNLLRLTNNNLKLHNQKILIRCLTHSKVANLNLIIEKIQARHLIKIVIFTLKQKQ